MSNKIIPSNDEENNESVSKRLNPIFAAASKSLFSQSNQRPSLASLTQKSVENTKNQVTLNDDSGRSDDDVSMQSKLPFDEKNTEKRRYQHMKVTMPSNRVLGTITPGSIISATNSSLSSPFKRNLPPFVAGDRCCILFDTVRDFFGRSCSGWFPGTVTEIFKVDPSITSSPSTGGVNYNFKVTFDDNAQDTMSWPADALSFSKLRHIRDTEGEYYYRSVYDETGKETKSVFYCDLKPTTVYLGDLVMAYYQNGNKLAGNSGAWFRGRIAAVHKRSNKIFCDVAYDDGDYEEDVPLTTTSKDKMGDQHVILVLERGHSETYWLEGLTVDLPSDRWRSEKSGVLQRITRIDRKVEILYKRGKLVNYETKPYDDVIEKVFESARKKDVNMKICVWPFAEEELVHTPLTGSISASALKSGWNGPIETQKIHRTRMQRQISPGYSNQKSMMRSNEKTPQFCTPKSNRIELEYQDSESASTSPTSEDDERKCAFHSNNSIGTQDDTDDSLCDSFVESKAKAGTSLQRKRHIGHLIPKVAAPVQKKLKNRDSSELAAAQESDYDSDYEANLNKGNRSKETVAESKVLDNPVSQISLSLGATLMQAVNSSDSNVGIDQLNFLSNFHGAVPGQDLCQRLINMMVTGPTSENGTLVPDSFRMQEALDYINSILSRESAAKATINNFSKALGSDSVGLFFKQMTAQYYTEDADYNSVSMSSLKRIGQTVHSKICFASIYVKLLEHSVSDLLKASNSDETNLCDKKCTVLTSIRAFPSGTKGTLVKSVELCVSFWFANGHFILYGDPVVDSFWNHASSPTLDDAIHRVRAHSLIFFKMMGIVISYMARLYSIDANENVDALADLIRLVVLRELENQKQKHKEHTELSSGIRKGSKEVEYKNQNFKNDDEYSRKIQFQFLVQLRKKIIPKLKPKLAVRFKLVKEYNAVYG